MNKRSTEEEINGMTEKHNEINKTRHRTNLFFIYILIFLYMLNYIIMFSICQVKLEKIIKL
jgi:hypothetical protein